MQSISNQHGAVVKISTGQIILCSTNFSNETMNPNVEGVADLFTRPSSPRDTECCIMSIDANGSVSSE